ncbi:ABC transporter permease [Arcobacter arenosus]|uniref:FtsX-like permease family protein n=1 Tax=Arcobacter arenosus TaxID=2576037 RepID=A0A5R8Y447_9BACT|nr:FtsX-like permease family protein [Arcobacter arenosus]TLP40846.1 FtsX-like permease family protein [Arcobacter arenosus]
MNTIFDYTLRSLKRFGMKNISIALIFMILVWLLSSGMMISNSLNHELKTLSKGLPDIIVQNYKGGKVKPFDEEIVEQLWDIKGISNVMGRIWGQYYLKDANIYASIVGVTAFEEQYKKSLTKIAEDFPESDDAIPSMMISKNLKELLFKYDMQEYVSFKQNDGTYLKMKLGGTFKADTQMESNDIILIPTQIARNLLDIEEGSFTDAVISVANPEEVEMIAAKIAFEYPSLRVITKADIIKGHQILYDYKSGWFLALLITTFITFAIILYDKASGLRSEEKQEIGVLKALGWEIDHIIRHKLTEALILSLSSFFVGVSLAIFYVFILDAPILKYVFTGFSNLKQPFDLVFVLDVKMIALLFFTTVPLYLAASIIPSWKAAVEDAGEVIR